MSCRRPCLLGIHTVSLRHVQDSKAVMAGHINMCSMVLCSYLKRSIRKLGPALGCDEGSRLYYRHDMDIYCLYKHT